MIEALLKYQEVDANLRKIEMEISGSEERKKTVSAKKYLEGVEENVKKLDIKATELMALYEKITNEQLQLKEQQEEFNKAIEDVSDENGSAYLLKKIDELVAKIKALDKDAIKLTEEINAVLKEYSNIKNTTKAAQKQYAEYGQKYTQLKASKKEEMEAIEKQLAVLRKDVDKGLMERYDAKRADKIFPIIFEVSEDSSHTNFCGACSMQLSMIDATKLKNGEIIECDHCRRLLYKK